MRSQAIAHFRHVDGTTTFLPVNTNRFVPSTFHPARWLPGPHLQTLGARFLRPSQFAPLDRERVELPDGDFVDLDFTFAPEQAVASPRPVVLLLHGLEGSARSKYALVTYRALRDLGVSAVGLNFRSCSGELNRLPRMYHSGDTGDLRFVLELLRERYSDQPLGAVGFSLGGNVLLKLLGEMGADASRYVNAAAAVSVPYDLSAGADYLERWGAWIYTSFLLRKLRRKVDAKRAFMQPVVDVERAVTATTFRDFDDAATAPLHAFDGAEDYYRRSSSRSYVGRIRVPTLLVQSADDPFQPGHRFPIEAARANPVITTAFTDHGGHVGFVGRGPPWRPFFWAENEVARFLGVMLNGGSSSRRQPKTA